MTEQVTIDGYTQSGASENTLEEGNDAVLKVQLNGAEAGSANGLAIQATGSTIRGLAINRFGGNGILILSSGATSNTIEGNFIGTDPDGTTDHGNGNNGAAISSADDNTIGGPQPEDRNVISGNAANGVDLSNSSDNRIEGNFIGTTSDGTDDLGNSGDGVSISGAVGGMDNTIGGTADGAGNVISGNEDEGVDIFGSSATGNKIEGNFIGTMSDGTGDLGNSNDGVFIWAEDNTVGGTTGGAGNRIAHNGGAGVSLWENDETGNSVLSNSIFQNARLGINLRGGDEDANGVTANDTDDLDTGVNNLQNFPVIGSATRNSTTGVTTIPGTLNSNPSQSYTIQCFLTGGPDPSGHGEGSFLLDTVAATTDANGDGNFTCTSSLAIIGQLPNPTVSATATNTATDDTSEFSENEPVSIP